MACARPVTTTLAMLCTLAVSGVSGQLQFPTPNRPQLDELQQLTRLLENELQQYELRQNNNQQPWWAQQQKQQFTPVHLQNQPGVVLGPNQDQLAQLQKQLQQSLQNSQRQPFLEQQKEFGQRIKQRPPPSPLFPQQQSAPILFAPEFKPLPGPIQNQQWQPIRAQSPLLQQPQNAQQFNAQLQALAQQPLPMPPQLQNLPQLPMPLPPQSQNRPLLPLPPALQIPQQHKQQQSEIPQQAQYPQLLHNQPPSIPLESFHNQEQPEIPQQPPLLHFQPLPIPPQPQRPESSLHNQQPSQTPPSPVSQPPRNQPQLQQQPQFPSQSQTPFVRTKPRLLQSLQPNPQQDLSTKIPLNLQQQLDGLDLSQLNQLVQLQQDIDDQQEKHLHQRQQQQLLQQQQQNKDPQQTFQQQRQPEKQNQEQPKRPSQQQTKEKQKAATNSTAEKPIKSVRDLFNTTSCVDPPYTCPHPRIQFYLYTRATQDNPKLLDLMDAKSLRSTDFDPSLPIKVLIHGFQGGRNFSPSTDLRKAYFTRGGYNVIVVEYGSLVRLPCLNQVQWSPSFLALCISQMVTYIGEAANIPPERFHLIGYSIGAHVAGLVANYVGERRLGRITGLDPTIIFYQGTNKSHDLDPSDARFVDVIHTGAGILGQRGPNGHVDYYVNGGTTQPGCQSDSLIKTLSCDHTKVSPYYVESIVTPVGFWALPCPNYFMYLLGLCIPEDKDYIMMGEDAPLNARGIYYVTTNANKPYAKGWPGKGPRPRLPGRARN